jgi:hypothetical protein
VRPKAGFTLFELILVVSLIGLFFIFIIPNILRKQAIIRDTNLTDLKSYVSNYRIKSSLSDVVFECGANFKKCAIKDSNGSIIEDGIELKVANPSMSAAYDFDPTGKEFEINFDGVKDSISQKKTFFRLKFFANGTTDSFVFYDGKGFFVFDTMSKLVARLDSLDDAKKIALKYDKMPTTDSKYYFNE